MPFIIFYAVFNYCIFENETVLLLYQGMIGIPEFTKDRQSCPQTVLSVTLLCILTTRRRQTYTVTLL